MGIDKISFSFYHLETESEMFPLSPYSSDKHARPINSIM